MARKTRTVQEAAPVAEVPVVPEAEEPTVAPAEAEAAPVAESAPEPEAEESGRTYVRWDVPADTEAWDAEMARLHFELGNARKRVAGHADKGRTAESHAGMAQAQGWVLRTERKITVLAARIAEAAEAAEAAEPVAESAA